MYRLSQGQKRIVPLYTRNYVLKTPKNSYLTDFFKRTKNYKSSSITVMVLEQEFLPYVCITEPTLFLAWPYKIIKTRQKL